MQWHNTNITFLIQKAIKSFSVHVTSPFNARFYKSYFSMTKKTKQKTFFFLHVGLQKAQGCNFLGSAPPVPANISLFCFFLLHNSQHWCLEFYFEMGLDLTVPSVADWALSLLVYVKPLYIKSFFQPLLKTSMDEVEICEIVRCLEAERKRR